VTSDDAPTRPADSDDLPTLRGLIAGQKVFGRYVLAAEVGRGGMGVVWRAQDAELNETVALKFLPDVVARDEAAVDELKAEARHARRLTHAAIVRIHQFERDGTMAAVSMEFVDGVTLSKLRLAQPAKVFSVAALKPLLAQLCAALEYAHVQAKLVHRDLKPANLLVTNEGQLKITDFGIARSLSDTHTRLTGREGDSSGTLAYMSPQQLLGTKPTVTDDIYALGATLYELLTGKPPFFTGDIAAQVRAVNPPSLAERRTELDVVAEPIPPAWEHVILACLAKRPEDRPQSSGEVARRLGVGPNLVSAPAGESVRADGVAAVPAEKVPRKGPETNAGPTRPVRSRRRAALLCAVGLGGLVVLICFFWRSGTQRGGQTTPHASAVSLTPLAPVSTAPVAPAPREEVKPMPVLGVVTITARPGTMVTAINMHGKETRIGAVPADGVLTSDSLLPVDTYTFKLENPDCLSVEVNDVGLVAGRTTKIAPAQMPRPGELRVISVPAGAEVRVNGQVVGQTPATLQNQPAEQLLRLEVQAPGFKTTSRSQTLPANGRETWQVTLERLPYPQPGQPWENTLGMRFVPVPGADALFAIWDARVQDFEAFVKESGYDATGGMYSLGSDGWKQRGNTWRSPGFPQGNTHPVCGVSWNDAKAFCTWLTEKERREGRLSPDQEYRLPADAEWSMAVGLDEPQSGTPQSKSLQIRSVYPWGTRWPPPSGAGNYAGREVRDGSWPADWSVIDGYGDGYPRTSPVSSFTVNRFGLYDMGGNVWQWCEDFYNGSGGSRVLRGGSFGSNLAGDLLSSNRNIGDSDKRYDFAGFRSVIAARPDRHDP
jgi:hypothetical protein